MMNKRRKVFVVHGQQHNHRDKLVKIIRELGLDPIVLEFARKTGKSIYEEFIDQAKSCEFAFILLTADDKMAADLDEADKYRARQNVIFEMGWFYAKIGRQRTRLLYSGKVELPSDVTGVIYIRFEDDLNLIRTDIRESLEAGGLL
jgi:predicted nucleotide-binding protein